MTIGGGDGGEGYLKRNCYMADHAQYMVAVYDRDTTVRSITGQTVNYAIRKGLKVTYIHPDTARIT